jgi:hypothetical protein
MDPGEGEANQAFTLLPGFLRTKFDREKKRIY